VILDGSFIMGCIDEPSDIDLILVLPADWDSKADLRPYQYSLVSRRRVRKEYGLDVIAVLPGSAAEKEWIAYFQQVNTKWCSDLGWPKDSTNGIVMVTL
jgi:hypothetical protein